MMQRLLRAMGQFMIVLVIILAGFVLGLYYIQKAHDYDYEVDDEEGNALYNEFRYLFLLTVGGVDFEVTDSFIAQIYSIIYIVIAAILMMNLLIALLTTSYDEVYKQ